MMSDSVIWFAFITGCSASARGFEKFPSIRAALIRRLNCSLSRGSGAMSSEGKQDSSPNNAKACQGLPNLAKHPSGLLYMIV